MLNTKSYSCGICKTKPDQISHHKSHIETQKHKDKKDLFELKLSKLNNEDLENKYQTLNINDIIKETETVIYTSFGKNTLLKKLKLNEVSNLHQTSDEMNSLKDKIISESNSVSNKEALKDKIHAIHNFLRNNGAGYGMNALKVFNILFGLKKIEEYNLLDKVSLKKPDCEFSYLLSLANENKDEQLAELIFGNVLQSICDSELKELLFYEIPQNIRGAVFVYLIKEIDKITIIEKTCNVLLSGKIYEYFIGRDKSAISELGAYFTDRHIVDYILNKLDPSINEDGTILSMVDMFGGSGGFTTGYINYLNNKYNKIINWNTEINKISHFDMNEDVIKSAGLEFFCLTGVLPNMNNLKYKNSFIDEFNGHKYKYTFTNPPYGGEISKTTEAQIKRKKVNDYIKEELKTITDEGLRIRRQKQLENNELQEKQEKKEGDKTKVSVSMCSARIQKFAKNYGLKGNDKESCSLILLMDMLDLGGTAVCILKEGVFYDTKYKEIRKCLIEKFNVREIITLSKDQFENTQTSTKIIIFDNMENGQTTSEVKFSDLIVEKYTEDKFAEILGNIVIIENKGDIVGVSDIVVSAASRDEILKNNICSLDGKVYIKKNIIVGKDYKLVKLGDICEFLPKSKRNASFGSQTGTYNFYTSSNKVQKCDVADYDEEALIIGDGGVANIKLDNVFSCSDHNYIIKTPNNKYIFHLINGNMQFLIDGFSGSVLKNISKTYLKNLDLPIPTSVIKIQEWEDKISEPYNEKHEKQKQIQLLETIIQNKITDILKNHCCEDLNFEDVLKYVSKKNKYRASDGKPIGKYRFYTSSQEKILYRDDYEFEEPHILIGRGGNASLHMSSMFSVSHDDVYVLTTQKPEYNLKYIYYFIKMNIDLISDSFKGTTIKHSSKTALSNITIKLPKNKHLILDLETSFQEIETIQNEIIALEKLYKQYIEELSMEAIPKKAIQITQPILKNDTVEEIVAEIEIKKEQKNINKKVVKKPKLLLVVENEEEQTL